MSTEAMTHAVEHPLLVDDDFQGTTPPKTLILGLDTTGNILEIIGRYIDDDTFLIFHAMPIRTSLLPLLRKLTE